MAIDSASGMHSRRTVLGILAAAIAPMMPGLAHGQSQQPIRLNVPFSPGTGPDLLARILSEELRQRWNHPVIVENKPGAQRQHRHAGRRRALRLMARTLLVTVNTFVMNASLYPIDPLRSGEGFRADRRDRDGRSWRSSFILRSTSAHVRGADRTCPQQAGRDQLCFARPRHATTSRHGAVEADGADQPDAHSLFRLRRRGEGSCGRTRLGHVLTGPYRASSRRNRVKSVSWPWAARHGRRRRRKCRRSPNLASPISTSICGTRSLLRPVHRRPSSTATMRCSTKSSRSQDVREASRQARLDRSRRRAGAPGRADRQGSPALGQSSQGCRDYFRIDG